MSRRVSLALALLVALSGCRSDITVPELQADPGLTLDEARARWIAGRPADYSFEFQTYTAMLPSAGAFRATVMGGRLVMVARAYTGEIAPIQDGFTIDELFDRLAAARARGEALSELQFSREGIPIRAMVGSFANDGGVRYETRAYLTGRQAF